MRILVLSTWFPYPTDQGSKIRAYHLIKGLAQEHELALISFEDKPIQPQWMDHMRQYCQRIEIVPRQPFAFSRLGTLVGWFSLQPSAVIASYSQEMAGCVQQTATSWQPDLVLAITFVTVPYALQLKETAKVVDVDNLLAYMLYEEYLDARKPLQRIRRYLAYWKMLQYEHSLFRKFDLGLIVSERDARRVLEKTKVSPSRVGLVPNGVDLQYYQPAMVPAVAHQLVFNGALTYEPNFDAMEFFLGSIFPRVLAQIPSARLYITGKTQGVAVDTLPKHEQVTFTGYLDDIRPTVASSQVCVVPLRQGAGTRLKILEAMALGVPVVSTTKGAEGLDVVPEKHLLIADQPDDFAAQTIRLMQDTRLRATLASQARQLLEEKYDWQEIGRHFCNLVNQVQQGTTG